MRYGRLAVALLLAFVVSVLVANGAVVKATRGFAAGAELALMPPWAPAFRATLTTAAQDRRGVPVPGPRPDGVDRRTLAAGGRRGGPEAAGATSQRRLRCVLGLPRSARVPAEPRPALR